MLKKKSAFVVCFMGVDGSGKTTLINNLKKEIYKNYFKVRYLHFRPYLFLLDKRNVVSNPHFQKKKYFKFIDMFRLFYWLLVYKVYFFFLKFQYNQLIIFDRYIHDILIDKIRYKFNLSNNITKKILSFFPEPNLWIFLNGSLDIITKRKKELPKSQLHSQTMKYKIFFKNKKNLLKLNSNLEIKKNVLILANKIKSINL